LGRKRPFRYHSETGSDRDKRMTLIFRLEPVIENLPHDFEAMRVEAYTEGYRFVERLATDWEAGVTRFDRDGEALVAARVDDVLAGIGGLTLDPVVSGALRMRRFYVRPSFRKHGIGRKLVGTLLEYPRRIGQVVVVNASRGSRAFWEKLGFAPDMRDGHTHILHLALGDTSA
jgi:GNAT superfamily N-acetyltransferase